MSAILRILLAILLALAAGEAQPLGTSATSSPPGEQQGSLAVRPVDAEGVPDSLRADPDAREGTSRRIAPTTPAPVPAAPSGADVSSGPDPSPAPTLRPVVFSGIASHYSAAYSEWWVAIPQGPGYRIRVCGAGGCRTLLSTDTGPTVPGRIVDLPIHAWEAVCGVPWWYGLCPVSVAIVGGVR